MLLSVRPQYFESDYKMSSQNGDLSSSIRPRKLSLPFFRIKLYTCVNWVHCFDSFKKKTTGMI